jgi:hypothetical protein
MAFPTKCYEITIDFGPEPRVGAVMDFHDMAVRRRIRTETTGESGRRELAQPSLVVAPGAAR